MTAEIAVMNKSAVALAADSAVTIQIGESTGKIYNTVNKLFAISRHLPVGFMVYGNAQFMETPWETIIKNYKKELVKRSKGKLKEFDNLDDYGKHFINHLRKNKLLFTNEKQNLFVENRAYRIFDLIKQYLLKTVKSRLIASKHLSDKEVMQIFHTLLPIFKGMVEKRNNYSPLIKTTKTRIIKKYKNNIVSIAKKVFQGFPIDSRSNNILTDIVAISFFEDMKIFENSSGIVIAGFGLQEEYPSLVCYEIDGFVDNVLRYKIGKSGKISVENRSSIFPFAQKEVVQTFMNGIHPDYSNEINHYIKDLLESMPSIFLNGEKISKKKNKDLKKLMDLQGEIFIEKMQSYQEHYHWRPVLKAVTFLPKDELALLAESLVNITSLKRKVSMDLETVGGLTDVAVISKGDGFIWIKQKNYFDSKLNNHFTMI